MGETFLIFVNAQVAVLLRFCRTPVALFDTNFIDNRDGMQFFTLKTSFCVCLG